MHNFNPYIRSLLFRRSITVWGGCGCEGEGVGEDEGVMMRVCASVREAE